MNLDYKIIPQNEASSAGVVGFTGHGISSLSELTDIFDGNQYKETAFDYEMTPSENDFIDISALKGQEKSKRALLICAAGFHNILLLGSPGSGKTMCGKILSGILPKK